MSQKHQNLLSLFLAIPFAVSCESAAETQSFDTFKFNPEPYCQEVDRANPKIIPKTVMSLLEGNDGSADGNQIAEAILIKAAIDIAHASETKEACKNTFETGAQAFYPFLRGKQAAFQSLGNSRLKRNADIRDIQQNIIRLWREDQSARGVYVALQTNDKTGKDYWASRLSAAHTARIDKQSKQYVKAVLKDFDWIDRKRFGRTVSDHAWLLVQHADDDPAFQSLALERMEPYLHNGGVNRSNYAYLFDRVAVNTGKKQRYGTQPDWNCVNGEMKLQALEDPENVNKRRKKMKLNSVEAGLAEMNRQSCLSGEP